MIKLVKREYLHPEKYNRCIQLDAKGLPYGYSWYLDAVCEQWTALVLNDYDAVWPLAVGKKYGLTYAFRPIGVQQLGIHSLDPLSEAQLQDFIQVLMRHFRFADLFMSEGQLPAMESSKIQVSPYTNMLLDVNRPYAEVHQGYKKKLRQKIRRVERQNALSLFQYDSPDVLLKMFSETKGQKIKLQRHFTRNMEKAMYQWLHHGMGKLWTAYNERNQPMASVFIVETPKRSILFSSALAEEGRELEAKIFLLHHYLQNIAGKKAYFDFEGTEDPGLAVFNRAWGVNVHPYYRLVYNNLPWPVNKFKK